MRQRLPLPALCLPCSLPQVQHLEAMRDEEQQRAATLHRQLAELDEAQFRAAQELAAAQERERRLGAEAGGAQVLGRNLSHKLAQLEEQLMRQQVGDAQGTDNAPQSKGLDATHANVACGCAQAKAGQQQGLF